MLKRIKEFPIEIITGLTDDVFEEAGRIKSKYKIPLGDSIVAAECLIKNGTLVTSDHDDFEKIKEAENIKKIGLDKKIYFLDKPQGCRTNLLIILAYI